MTLHQVVMKKESALAFILICLVCVISAKAEELEEYIKIRRLREAGFEDFEVTSFWELDEKRQVDTDEIHRRKRSLDLQTISLKLKAFKNEFEMTLLPTKSVLHHQAKIITTIGDVEEVWEGSHPDCFLTGKITTHSGTASLSYCDGMQGGMTTKEHEYQIETLPRHLHKRDTARNIYDNILVSRRNIRNDKQESDIVIPDSDLEEHHHRQKRFVPPSSEFTIELAVYTDAEFTKIFHSKDRAKRVESIVTKYNGVQMEYTRDDQLGYNITIVIKYINFMEDDPIWYNATSQLSVGMKHICQHTKDTAYDHVFLHTGVANPSPTGLAYTGRICLAGTKCAVSSSKSVVSYIATAHEMGHNLGMSHDDTEGCNPPDVGVMGSYGAGWSTCSKKSMDDYIATGNAACLWSTNVAEGDVPADLKSIKLDGKIPGLLHTADEICEKMRGSGYRFREYPQVHRCQLYSCIDMNRGSTYGKMTKESESINGLYCGEGKICFKNECKTLAEAKQYGVEVQAGGWSSYGAMSACSRTCGTGVKFRRRVCNNPRPFLHAGCTGDEYEAELCNTTPCPEDSVTESTLTTARASETCATLIANNVISSDNYQSTGTVYNNIKMGKCEVKCDTKDGYTTPSYTRFGLMPDGSPCSSDEMSDWDKNNWPRRLGYNDYCFEGYCRVFGCDGKLNGKTFDECGQCGGDNSTCTVVSGTYMGTINQGARFKVWEIPTGAYNIQFWYTFSAMKKIYLELYDKDGVVILATNKYASQVTDSRTVPISFAGTYWYYFYNSQYLYAKGSLTEPAFVYVYNKGTNTNKGIHYAYSLPKDIGSCTGSCQNSGTWNSTLCACDCPSGKYGVDCSSSCNKYCWNGGTVVQSGCSCKCTDNAYDSKCSKCKAVFTGEDCKTCKFETCQNCGVFNKTSCRCQCLDGYGGFECEKTCEDTDASCTSKAASGECESKNADMERDCPLSCGLCVAKSPPDVCLTTTPPPATDAPSVTTTTTASPTCDEDTQFQCRSSQICIPKEKKCNNITDCFDESDEDMGDCFSNSSNSLHNKNIFLILFLLLNAYLF